MFALSRLMAVRLDVSFVALPGCIGITFGAAVWAWLFLMMCCFGGFCGLEAVIIFHFVTGFLKLLTFLPLCTMREAYEVSGAANKRFLLPCVAGM